MAHGPCPARGTTPTSGEGHEPLKIAPRSREVGDHLSPGPGAVTTDRLTEADLLAMAERLRTQTRYQHTHIVSPWRRRHGGWDLCADCFEPVFIPLRPEHVNVNPAYL